VHGMWRLRRWAKRIAPKALILLYHRVAEVSSDPQLLCVSPKHFAEHLEVLRRNYYPLSLRSLRRRLALNLWPPRSVVITFDDGYADNLYQARPLLEAADVPATVFIVAGKIDSQQEFWWDELERILFSAPKLPTELNLTINGQLYRWTLGQSERFETAWHVEMQRELTPRERAYLQLTKVLRSLQGYDREAALTQLFAWTGLERTARSSHRGLTADEVQKLAADGLVEVGAHTMTHPVLSELSVNSQYVKIAESKRKLEEILGQAVTSFSYPFGGRSDYNAATMNLVKKVGFSCACSNFPGHVRWGADPYQLPRYLVRDWDGDEFQEQLMSWFVVP